MIFRFCKEGVDTGDITLNFSPTKVKYKGWRLLKKKEEIFESVVAAPSPAFSHWRRVGCFLVYFT